MKHFFVKDHFLSQEVFEIKNTEWPGVKKTSPIPLYLDKYYESKNYISHYQERKTLKNRLYKFFQLFNLKYKKNILKNLVPKGSKVLDYGAGAGEFANLLQHDFETLAFEPNNNAAFFLIKKLITGKVIQNLDEIENKSLSAITLWHVLEHIPDPKNILKVFWDKLEDGGYLVLALPNPNSLDAKIYQEYWAAWDVPRHLYHYNENGIKEITKDYFLLKATKPLILDAYYISWISEKYQKKNPIMAFIKGVWNGYKSNKKAKKTGEYSSKIYVLKKISLH